jgi:hypothetical protein
MLLTTDERNVSMNGMLNVKEFTIKAGPHMMAILSGLYTNPVDAMVREYLTNMIDGTRAFIRQNPNVPYRAPELHLPTTLTPTLVFKDYGIGMDFNTVWQVYTSYGDSTKTNSNDDTGGFGIGSKTAFCYNNGQQWTIESRHNGEIMTFMAFVNETGVPTMTHVATMPTSEDNGITLRIPILRADIPAVAVAAKKYVPHADYNVTVINSAETYTKPSYKVTGSNWGLLPRGTTKSSYGSYVPTIATLNVIMGGVPYHVDTAYFGNLGNISRQFLSLITYHNIDITLPIGAVDIIPSRDGLKYTDRTKNTIIQALQVCLDELKVEVSHRIAHAKNEYEALSVYETLDFITNLSEIIPNVQYNNKALLVNNGGITKTLEELQSLDKTAEVSQYSITSSYRSTPEIQTTLVSIAAIHPKVATTIVMIDDMTKGAAGVAKAYAYTSWTARSSATGRALKYGHTVGTIILVRTTLSKSELSEFFGGLPVDLILSAQALSGTVRMPKDKGNANIYKLEGKSWAARIKIPKNGPYYYVTLTQNPYNHRFEAKLPVTPASPSGGMINGSYISQLTNTLSELGIDAGVVYGIRDTELSNFDAPDWKPLFKTVTDAAKAYLE